MVAKTCIGKNIPGRSSSRSKEARAWIQFGALKCFEDGEAGGQQKDGQRLEDREGGSGEGAGSCEGRVHMRGGLEGSGAGVGALEGVK